MGRAGASDDGAIGGTSIVTCSTRSANPQQSDLSFGRTKTRKERTIWRWRVLFEINSVEQIAEGRGLLVLTLTVVGASTLRTAS